MPVVLTIEGLTKSYESVHRGRRLSLRKDAAGPSRPAAAFSDVSFEVRRGEIFTLLGPSGCGKTTVLRSIAGLERPDAGRIVIAGETVFDAQNGIDLPPALRGISMVFQSYAIWPHMTVAENAAFPLEVKPRGQRLGRKQISAKVDEVLEVTGLTEYRYRDATALSGGQQQRLALARALVVNPSLLLLDEPLSNLDAKLRQAMRREIARIQIEYGVTAIYVTHDQSEALAMSTRVAVMNLGRVMQLDDPRGIYERPASRFVADFVGEINLFHGVVSGNPTSGGVTLHTKDGPIACHDERAVAGDEVTIAIRPLAVRLRELTGPDDTPMEDEWEGRVLSHAYLGGMVEHLVEAKHHVIRALTEAARAMDVGAAVAISFDPRAVIVVPPDVPSDPAAEQKPGER